MFFFIIKQPSKHCTRLHTTFMCATLRRVLWQGGFQSSFQRRLAFALWNIEGDKFPRKILVRWSADYCVVLSVCKVALKDFFIICDWFGKAFNISIFFAISSSASTACCNPTNLCCLLPKLYIFGNTILLYKLDLEY